MNQIIRNCSFALSFLLAGLLAGTTVVALSTQAFGAETENVEQAPASQESIEVGDEIAQATETDGEGLGIPTEELPETDSNGGLVPNPDYSDPKDTKPNEGPLPEIQRDFSKLPEPVQRMRTLILEAARMGDVEKLRPLLGIGETATNLSLEELDGDSIEYLKSLSGDEEGLEILGILIEILEMGYVHLDPGTEDEVFVWPYFFSWPIDSLSAKQKVEMYTILTAGDVEDSVNFGGYIFYRAGIKPDGSWNFFVSGD